MSAVTHRAPRASTATAGVAGLLATLVLGVGGLLPLVAGLLGTGGLLGGTRRRERALVTAGGGVFLAGVVVAGIVGVPPFLLLVGFVAAVVAWDAAETGLTLGEQLGGEAPTGGVVAVGIARTTAVTGMGAAVAFALYRQASAGQPTATLIVLLAGGLLLVTLLRD